MSETDQNETGRNGTPMGKEFSQPADDDEGSITSGSPGNLVLVAVVVGLLIFAGAVFYIAARLADSDGARDNWQLADVIIQYVSSAIFYSALLVGLGALAAARSKGASLRSVRVASLLSKAGAAVIILGVAEAVCIIGTNQYSMGWQWEASQAALRVGTRVFEGGVLAGVALLCLRQARRGSLQGGQS